MRFDVWLIENLKNNYKNSFYNFSKIVKFKINSGDGRLMIQLWGLRERRERLDERDMIRQIRTKFKLILLTS